MNDRYTKVILTIIAGALSAIALQSAFGPARAQLGDACTRRNPCFVDYAGLIGGGLPVSVTNEPLWITKDAPRILPRR